MDASLATHTDEVHNILEKLSKLIEKKKDVSKKFLNIYSGWATNRSDTINILQEIEENLKKIKQDVNITHTVSASVGLVGGGVTLAGIFFAPVTFGISTVAVGIGTSVLAGATSIGASVTEIALIKSRLKKCNKVSKTDMELTEELYTYITETRNIDKEIVHIIDALGRLHDSIKLLIPLESWTLHDTVRLGVIGVKALEQGQAAFSLTKAGKIMIVKDSFVVAIERMFVKESSSGVFRGLKNFFTKGNTVVGESVANVKNFFGIGKETIKDSVKLSGSIIAIGMVFDVIQLIDKSFDLAKGSPSAEAEKIKDLIEKLKKEQDDMKILHDYYIEHMD